MPKLFQDAVDKNVVATFAYMDSEAEYAYSDEACTVKMTAENLKEAFLKGMLIISLDPAYVYRPVTLIYKDRNDYSMVMYFDDSGDIRACYSREYQPEEGGGGNT